jgi:H+/Cl- antiporter ClcA
LKDSCHSANRQSRENGDPPFQEFLDFRFCGNDTMRMLFKVSTSDLYGGYDQEKMKQKFIEESVLLVSILKWFVLATGIGVVVGLSTTLFLKFLYWSVTTTNGYPYYFLLLPLGFFLSSLIIHHVEPDARGYGTEKVIEAVHKRFGKMNFRVVPIKLAATIITAAAGGSIGQIGPCAQIGAALSSFLGHAFKLDDNDVKKLVICGISAGFASVLGSPIAGAIFGVEVLFVGGIMYEVLLPSFIAGITSYQISSWLGIHYIYYPVKFIPPFSETFFFQVVVSGIFFGLCAIMLIETMRMGERLSGRLSIWPPLKGIVGGVMLIGLTFIFSPAYLGLGIETIQASLRGEQIVLYAFLVKALFTSISFGAGGSGGIITPILFVGATAGSLFGDIAGLDKATFAAIGLVSVLAGAANTPIAASILAMELMGQEIAPYAAVACVVSFLMTGHRGIFTTQLLYVKKSSSVEVEVGTDLEGLKTRFNPREKSVSGMLIKLISRARKIKRKNGD